MSHFWTWLSMIFSNIMWIWCSISMVSMLIGLFLFPNQNLNQKEPNLAKNDSLASVVFYRQFKLKKESLKGRFRERKRFNFWAKFSTSKNQNFNVLKSSLFEITYILGSFIDVFSWKLHHRIRASSHLTAKTLVID